MWCCVDIFPSMNPLGLFKQQQESLRKTTKYWLLILTVYSLVFVVSPSDMTLQLQTFPWTWHDCVASWLRRSQLFCGGCNKKTVRKAWGLNVQKGMDAAPRTNFITCLPCGSSVTQFPLYKTFTRSVFTCMHMLAIHIGNGIHVEESLWNLWKRFSACGEPNVFICSQFVISIVIMGNAYRNRWALLLKTPFKCEVGHFGGYTVKLRSRCKELMTTEVRHRHPWPFLSFPASPH